jgi:hypothetical protein
MGADECGHIRFPTDFPLPYVAFLRVAGHRVVRAAMRATRRHINRANATPNAVPRQD